MIPDVIFASPVDAASLAERPGWSEIRAVKRKAHLFLSAGSAGHRRAARPPGRDGMRALADCLAKEAP